MSNIYKPGDFITDRVFPGAIYKITSVYDGYFNVRLLVVDHNGFYEDNELGGLYNRSNRDPDMEIMHVIDLDSKKIWITR